MLKKFLALGAVCFAVYFLISVPSVQKKFLYPFPYRTTIENYSARWHVDKFLTIAVMKVESNFQESANSQSGAVGLMQLMPETAAWIADQLDESPNHISEPEKNIRYGTWYLAELENEFNGNDVLALAAYNAGRGNVHDWMEKNHWSENFSDVDKIPYAETRDYVKKVLHCREKYSRLYGAKDFVPVPIALHELRFAVKNFSL